MSYYFVESEDKSFVNFKVFDTCTESHKRSLELAKLLDMPICVFKSFSYPQNRDDAFLWLTAYPNGKTKYIEEDLDKAIELQSKEMFKSFTK